MVERVYEQLKTPKSIEELYQRLWEIGVKWNKAQIELFLMLDGNVEKAGNLYSIKGNEVNNTVLNVIDSLIDGRPLISIKKIMENVPNDIYVSAEEITKIAEQSGEYKLHPNGAVLVRREN